ncbi:hypothetical protein [Sphingomonas sp. IC4-52]|uniref:hypothetical protein n=1 Tax=Sphingomonas sp. IC4-52 TaxID=2887202 RepID=UPI001D122918|nr:hypothetical protein [Sphingomonas sp. IC4-52]MCC2978823.1 hypothetical protein [Sphingomonas sp. IC4-52]
MSETVSIGQVVGRQPETLFITPSKPNPWYGSIVEGDSLTAQQRTVLSTREIDQSAVEIVTVYRQATTRELWWPSTQLPPLYAFECPVISRQSDGFVKVVAPFGDVKRVIPYLDRLWATLPRGLNRRGFRSCAA